MNLLQRKWHFGLTSRYILHLAAIGAFLSVLLVWNASLQQQHVVLKEMEQRGALLGESLSGVCTLRYLLGDLDAIRYIFDQSKDIQDVVSIRLIDRLGEAETQVGELSQETHFPTILENRKLTVWKDAKMMYVVAPLVIRRQKMEGVADMLLEKNSSRAQASQSDLLGYVYVSLSLKRANQFVRALILRSMAATTAIILLGSAVAFVFFRKTILNPIHELVDAMTAVRQGNLKMSLEGIARTDEIGTMTNAFNEMTRNLRKAEENLRQANSELEERVLERTRDLEEALRKLREAQEMMVRSEKLAAIGKLASGVGHELRNPLSAIRNAIYYIRDAIKDSPLLEQDPSIKEFFEIANVEIKSSNNIISDLLDFSRVGRLTLEPTNVNFLLTGIKSVLEVPGNIKVTENYGQNLPRISIDPQRMRQVFINLANNAIQSMVEGGEFSITTRFDPSAAPYGCILIDFKDDGVGISEANLKRIFEPLFTTKAKGTGLGLAICQGIVEGHDGKIEVRSEVGKGSTFTIRLLVGGHPNDA